jgi:hypothetical protein
LKRVPCRHCNSRIDQDWHRCPFCDGEDPIRVYRMKKRAGFGLLVVVAVVVIVAVPLLIL